MQRQQTSLPLPCRRSFSGADFQMQFPIKYAQTQPLYAFSSEPKNLLFYM